MERRTLKFLNESSDTVAKLLYMGEEKIVDIHNSEGEEVQESAGESSQEESSDEKYFTTNDQDFLKFRKAQKKGLDRAGDGLLGKLKNGMGDVGEDLDADFEIDFGWIFIFLEKSTFSIK